MRCLEGCTCGKHSGGFKGYSRVGECEPGCSCGRHRRRLSKVTSYSTMHQRLRNEFGKANTFTCSCGEPAYQWAYLHTGEPELIDPDLGYPYSMDRKDYTPMCVPCHKAYDKLVKEQRRCLTKK